MPAINSILEKIEELELEDQEELLDVLTNRVRDHRRQQLVTRATEAFSNANSGKSKTGTFEELWADLNG
jgi:hypothetical protein